MSSVKRVMRIGKATYVILLIYLVTWLSIELTLFHDFFRSTSQYVNFVSCYPFAARISAEARSVWSLVCASFQYTATYFVVLQVCVIFALQHLEHRTGCLKPSVAFRTGDHKSGLTMHSASYILPMCGNYNGCCCVYDVQYHTGCNRLSCLSYRISNMVPLECMVLLTY